MSKNVEEHVKKIIENGIVLYDCTKCHRRSDRRYNATRHYERFHTASEKPKQCASCSKKFITKGDLHEHREKVHNDKKRYCRQQRNVENQTKSSPCAENDSEQIKKETSYMNLNFTTSNNLRENYLSPKKRLLCKWQKTENSRYPFRSIENSILTTTNDNIASPNLIILNINKSTQHTYDVRSVSALTNILQEFIGF